LVCIFLVKTPRLRREMETIKWVQRALEKTQSNRVEIVFGDCHKDHVTHR
jgi:hypothetical protein